jgi:hypothetical protein
MTIQLVRVEIEYFHPGEEITGAGNVMLYTKSLQAGAGTGIWVSKTEASNDSVIVKGDKITFVQDCAYVRLKGIGLESNGLNSGDLDFRLSFEPVIDVLGQTLFELVVVGEDVTMPGEKGRKVTFIAVVFLTKDSCDFLGVLDLEPETLGNAIIPTIREGTHATQSDRE